jgi:hypothetical protein
MTSNIGVVWEGENLIFWGGGGVMFFRPLYRPLGAGWVFATPWLE